MHLRRVLPVVGRAGLGGVAAANESAVFDARHVVGVATRQKRVGMLLRIEPDQSAGRNQQVVEASAFFFRAVAPFDRRGLGQARNFFDPSLQGLMRHDAVISSSGTASGKAMPEQSSLCRGRNLKSPTAEAAGESVLHDGMLTLYRGIAN